MTLQTAHPQDIEKQSDIADDLASAAIKAVDGVRMLQSVTETELKFALTEEVLATLNLDTITPLTVTQYYLPDAVHDSLVDSILAGSGIDRDALPDGIAFSQMRVRKIQSDAGETYYLQAKAKLPDGEAAQKIEIGTEISEEEYKSLRDYSKAAQAGMIKKYRYKIEGELNDGSEVMPVTAEVDVVLKAGPKGEKVRTKFPIASVDIEVSDLSHLALLRSGHHSFEFLKGQVILTDADPKLRKALSTSGLGRKGVSARTEQALEEINSQQTSNDMLSNGIIRFSDQESK
jgi:hypothetical protein